LEEELVQPPENLTQIAGKIVGRKPHPALNDYDLVTVRVETAGPVESQAQILKPHPGDLMDLTVRRELLADAATGKSIRCRVKHGVNGAMAEPHPEPRDFSID
jgi:hypothetical protein